MAEKEHLVKLKQGVRVWNEWRHSNPHRVANLSGASLSRANLSRANLSRANLSSANLSSANLDGANLSGADLSGADLREARLSGTDLSGTDLSGAKLRVTYLSRANLSSAYLRGTDLSGADLSGTNLRGAYLSGAYLSGADLSGADLRGADLRGADLRRANLSGADLSRADLREANLMSAIFVSTDLTNANLSGCRIYGISAWNVRLNGTIQTNLDISDTDSALTVDNLEVAQFIYMLIHNEKLRAIIDTLTSKTVLILGRFTTERKEVLDAIRTELRTRNYTPILFDFEKPSSRDLTETIFTLAGMSRFVIADLSDPNSIPHELMSFVEKLLSVPVRAIFCSVDAHPNKYPMFEHLERYPQVIKPTLQYTNQEELISVLYEKVIRPSEEKVEEQRPKRL